MAINGESLVAAPVERRRSFHCWKGHLSSWNCKIVVNAVFLTCGTFISGFKAVKDYWRRASKWTSLGFRYSEMMVFGKMNVKNLSACGNRSSFLSVAQKRSLAVADLAVEWLHEHAKFFQEIETTSNFAMFPVAHPDVLIEVQLQLVSWQLAGRELPQRNIKSVWKIAR